MNCRVCFLPKNCRVLTVLLDCDCDVQDPEEWPLIAPLPSYGRGRERLGPRHISLIHGENLDDVVITGTQTVFNSLHFQVLVSKIKKILHANQRASRWINLSINSSLTVLLNCLALRVR